jgi:DNA-binding NtrC family response regulator
MTSIPFTAPTINPSLIPTLNLADLEKLAITKALAETGGNRVRAARLLGIHVRTLHRKLREEANAAAQPMQGMGNA